MKAKEITKELKKSGGVKGIANKMGVKSPTVSQVIHRVRPNQRIRNAIAEAIGRPVEEVFSLQENIMPTGSYDFCEYIGQTAVTIVQGKLHRSTIQRITGSGVRAVAILVSGVCVSLNSLIIE